MRTVGAVFGLVAIMVVSSVTGCGDDDPLDPCEEAAQATIQWKTEACQGLDGCCACDCLAQGNLLPESSAAGCECVSLSMAKCEGETLDDARACLADEAACKAEVLASLEASCVPITPEDTVGADVVEAAEVVEVADGVAPFDGIADAISLDGLDDTADGADTVTPPDPTGPVNGWILLDDDPTALVETIEAAAAFGVDHIQLSHDLVMNIDDLLGDSPEVAQRVETLSLGIQTAHDHGMKAYIWVHELSGEVGDLCYAPDAAMWGLRQAAYEEGLGKLPDLDGVILMFGSAPLPPWLAFCTCDWCFDTYGGTMLDSPPEGERIKLVVEHIGSVVTGTFGKELFIRTFVHEPSEIAWHSEGLAAVTGVPFAGMHKGPVQDWQPYNPHHGCIGAIGDHPAVVELDLAGEYYGKSELPFAAPGYYWYRMKYLFDHGGIGVVARVQRGSAHALGTPNEINLLAVSTLSEDITTPLGAIWDEFVDTRYGLAPGTPGQRALEVALGLTFPVRLKSHYTLGIWSLEKSSDIPEGVVLGELYGRGKMPKWDADWQGVWDMLATPTTKTVQWLWQEGTEAVVLASASREAYQTASSGLSAEVQADLAPRFLHQLLAARVWRAVDLFIWSHLAMDEGETDPLLQAWKAWAHQELTEVKGLMQAGDLEGVSLVNPAKIQMFIDKTSGLLSDGVVPSKPPLAPFLPVQVVAFDATSVTLEVVARVATDAKVQLGVELPDYGLGEKTVPIAPDTSATVAFEGLAPGTRYVVRVVGLVDGVDIPSGETWFYTPYEITCADGELLVEGQCLTACTPDCAGMCPGAPDGCGGTCEANACTGCCLGATCFEGNLQELCGTDGATCDACLWPAACDGGLCQEG